MNRALLASLATVAISVFAPSANAGYITGGIGFGGDIAPNTGDWDNATAVDFNANGGDVFVTSKSGTYAPIPGGTITSYTDFTFSPVLNPSPVNPLWTITYNAVVYDFVMDSVSVVVQGNNGLQLRGLGTLRATGFDDTRGQWDFSAQETAGFFSFSATNAPLPEPGSLALLGLGLIGVAAARRRRAH